MYERAYIYIYIKVKIVQYSLHCRFTFHEDLVNTMWIKVGKHDDKIQ